MHQNGKETRTVGANRGRLALPFGSGREDFVGQVAKALAEHCIKETMLQVFDFRSRSGAGSAPVSAEN